MLTKTIDLCEGKTMFGIDIAPGSWIYVMPELMGVFLVNSLPGGLSFVVVYESLFL